MERPIELILSKLDSAKANGQDSWQCRCPSHDDKRASLSVRVIGRGSADEKVLLHCFAGCCAEDIVTQLGLSMSDLYVRKEKEMLSNGADEYRYTDEEGNHLYSVVRTKEKKFFAKQPNGKWGLNGATTVLYKLPNIARAIKDKETVFIVEGEKDVATLERFGCIATCNTFGAGKWKDRFSNSLLGIKEAIVVPDNDEPGFKHAAEVAESLFSAGVPVKVIRLPDLKEKEDVSDWFYRGGTRDKLLQLCSEAERVTEPDENTKKKKINELELALQLKQKHTIIYSEEGKFFRYTDGYYQEFSEHALVSLISKEYGCLKNNVINLIIRYLKAKSEIKADMLNNDRFLNLENGLFDIESYQLVAHTSSVYSTIRINVTYDANEECPLWETAIKTIVQDEENIRTVQEFFGLCVTKETYDRALFFIGEGSNGKSTLLDVLKGILGNENTCEVQLEQLEKSHYVAQLHNKILNIATEIGAKGTVCDEMFKKIVTHDYVMGDHKFGHPFSFRPVCKLIFATNNMPRTDDKSRAFYRRLLIIPLTKEFTDIDNKHKYHRTLLTERNGIFNWMIEGLKRLKARDRFAVGKNMIETIESYRIENNPVLGFIEEHCFVEANASVAKRELYDAYRDYCDDSGFRAINIRKFGKELKRHLKSNLFDERSGSGNHRIWGGIRIKGKHECGDVRPY